MAAQSIIVRVATLALMILSIGVFTPGCEESRAQMAPEQPKNPEAEKLAKAIVNTISTNNYAAFTDLLIVQHDYVNIMRASSIPSEQLKANDSTAGMQKFHKDARRSFERVRERGDKAGLAWEKTHYKSCTYELDTVRGIEFITMYVVMEFREIEYPLTVQGIWKTSKGWKMFGPVEFGLKDTRSEDVARRIVDSIVVADSMAAVMMYMQMEETRRADSMAYVAMRRQADSAHMADSVATSLIKKGKKKK